MTAWQLVLSIGDETWTVEQELDSEVDDAPAVLDDLRFGWAMPKNGVYPAQPDAQSAEFSLNLPVFADYGHLAKGDPVTIELHIPSTGPVVASFYGRATDLKARPRTDRADPTVGGVTLDVIAIDYTADPAENRALDGPGIIPTVYYEVFALQTAFDYALGGMLDIDPGATDPLQPIPELWTAPTTVEVPQNFAADLQPALKIVEAVLLQAVTTAIPGTGGTDPVPGTPGTRMILSPLIGSDDLLPASGRRFTIDTITVPERDWVDELLDGDVVDFDVTWTQTKGSPSDRVVATYGESSLQTTATLVGATAPYADLPVALHLLDTEGARAAEVAAFYLPPDVADDEWQIESVTYLVDLLTEDQLDDFPTTLFPQWKADEGDPIRCACYSQLVWLDNVDPTVQPYATDGQLSGVLAGATVTIRDGLVSIDLALRAVRHHAT